MQHLCKCVEIHATMFLIYCCLLVMPSHIRSDILQQEDSSCVVNWSSMRIYGKKGQMQMGRLVYRGYHQCTLVS